jgi:hypothetical protein
MTRVCDLLSRVAYGVAVALAVATLLCVPAGNARAAERDDEFLWCDCTTDTCGLTASGVCCNGFCANCWYNSCGCKLDRNGLPGCR